jgi:transcriptional regulator with XRE-family HTH domain
MARAGLGWGIRDLARAAKVSLDTVVRFERGEVLRERTVEALQRAFELAGVEFTNGNRPGLRLPYRPDNDSGALNRPANREPDFWSNSKKNDEGG